MLSITRPQLELLIELQENERQALAIKAEIDKMPDKMAALEAGLQAWLKDLESIKVSLAALQKDYRSYEAELEAQQSRIKKRQVQLHSVKTNREYQGLLKEIDDIKSAGSRIEDTSLQCLDDIDKAEKELEEKNKAFASEQHRIEDQKQELAGESEKIKHRMEQLHQAAFEIENQLAPGLVDQYRQVKQRCGGIGLVQVENAVCKGCFLNIPPQMYNELHKGNELRMCPHCHRLIYVL